jgi:RNA-directed DNA polymerase
VISSKAFAKLDTYLWTLTYKWAKQAHPKKAKCWVVNRYFARFNRSRNDRWVFGDRNSGAYLVKHAWTPIVRHQMVRAGSSPDDPALPEYWASRRLKTPPPPMDSLSLRLLRAQKGTCPLCGELLLAAGGPPQSPHEWEQWVRITGKALTKRSLARQEQGASDDSTTLRLVHTSCHRRPRSSEAAAEPALLQRQRAFGLA